MSRKLNGPTTWGQCLPILLLAYAEGSPEGRRVALEELTRMAQAADAAVDLGDAVKAHDERLNAAEEPPTGDDYNDLCGLVAQHLGVSF